VGKLHAKFLSHDNKLPIPNANYHQTCLSLFRTIVFSWFCVIIYKKNSGARPTSEGQEGQEG
jgi:hypothetical protein